jgi:hypothetical protein
LLESFFELLLELVLEALGEFILTLGWESFAHALRGTRKANPVLAMLGWAVIGSICGVISALLFPERLLPPSRLPGMSLIVAPLVSGALMKTFGDRGRESGKDTTMLATFWGGTIFAFTVAATRFLLIREW